jgi:phosphate/sulfate permease
VQSKKAHELVTTGSPNIPAFPARMVLTVSFVLSPVIGLLVTVVVRKLVSRNLMPASRHQDHTTSPSDLLAFVWRNKPSIASRAQRVVTIAKRPSIGRETAAALKVICPTAKAENFCERGWTLRKEQKLTN